MSNHDFGSTLHVKAWYWQYILTIFFLLLCNYDAHRCVTHHADTLVSSGQPLPALGVATRTGSGLHRPVRPRGQSHQGKDRAGKEEAAKDTE